MNGRIMAIHLLNDYSGSPRVLMQAVQGWISAGREVHIFTAGNRSGFLSEIAGAQTHHFWYRWSASPYLRMIFLVISQIHLMIKLLISLTKGDIVYINTVLPFGAAIAGKIRGCRTICHLHETSMKPWWFKKILFGIIRVTAEEIIYVSPYLAAAEPMKNKTTYLLPNALQQSFLDKAIKYRRPKERLQNVLMVCSLKVYKGVEVYVQLAALHPGLQFSLVLNAEQDQIDRYFKSTMLPANLHIFSTCTDLHPHYAAADVLLSLSLPHLWIETFGLTVIEGMSYGLPAIVPEAGGIADLIQEGVNGFHADARDIDTLSHKLALLAQKEELYRRMCSAALLAAENYTEAHFIEKSFAILNTPSA